MSGWWSRQRHGRSGRNHVAAACISTPHSPGEAHSLGMAHSQVQQPCTSAHLLLLLLRLPPAPPGCGWCSTATPGSAGLSPCAGLTGAPNVMRGSSRTPQGSCRCAGGCAAACASRTSVNSPAPVRSRVSSRLSAEKVWCFPMRAAMRSQSSRSAGWPGAPANTACTSCRCRTYLQQAEVRGTAARQPAGSSPTRHTQGCCSGGHSSSSFQRDARTAVHSCTLRASLCKQLALTLPRARHVGRTTQCPTPPPGCRGRQSRRPAAAGTRHLSQRTRRHVAAPPCSCEGAQGPRARRESAAARASPDLRRQTAAATRVPAT